MSLTSYGSVAGVTVGFGCGVIVSWLLRRSRWSPVVNKDSADESVSVFDHQFPTSSGGRVANRRMGIIADSVQLRFW